MQNSSGLRPLEYNVVIRMDPVKERTAGGIILPTAKKDENELAADEGTLVAVSPHAFGYAEWPADQPPPKVGDRVLFARFDGRLHEKDGVKFRLVKDKSVIAVVDEAPALSAVA
jgi:co-chaperonin GroES (HSP10)